jgi:hypothetical protein
MSFCHNSWSKGMGLGFRFGGNLQIWQVGGVGGIHQNSGKSARMAGQCLNILHKNPNYLSGR